MSPISFYFKVGTRKFKITHVAHIMSLLEQYKSQVQEELGPPPLQSKTELNSRPHISRSTRQGAACSERGRASEGGHGIARATWDRHHSPVDYITEVTGGGPGLRLLGEET